MTQAYAHLCATYQLGHVQLQSRVIMGSMHTGLEDERGAIDKLIAFYQARGKGGVGLIITGGYSPNLTGRLTPLSSQFSFSWQRATHQKLTQSVQQSGARIVLQLLHAGRYAYHPFCVSASAIKAPISPFTPRKLSLRSIKRTIAAFVKSAKLAQQAGYDGIELMGSEGYLINQFLCTRSNCRDDAYGGSDENRMRFALELVSEIRRAVGNDFLIIFRLSLLDLVPQGSRFDEVLMLAKRLEQAGVSALNSGIGWHESRVPTIAASVPRAAFTWATHKLKQHVNVPVIAANRINTPELAEEVLRKGEADLISMARPLLADPEFVNKARNNHAAHINTCIACNQACLDHVFKRQRASCLVNPQACFETELTFEPATKKKTIHVVGAGPAGLAFACYAAIRGHEVQIFEKNAQLGGQFNLAKRIPSKSEFNESVRYFTHQLETLGVSVRLQSEITTEHIDEHTKVHWVFATGVTPRRIDVEGSESPLVCSYLDVLEKRRQLGGAVAIIGAGGIGIDVAHFICAREPTNEAQAKSAFMQTWGIDEQLLQQGALLTTSAAHTRAKTQVYLCQRSTHKLGQNLGKTTAWIHRKGLKNMGVEFISGVDYQRIDEQGLHIKVNGKARVLHVSDVVVCAGQESNAQLYAYAQSQGIAASVIGGAQQARELDAKRAILSAAQLAREI